MICSKCGKDFSIKVYRIHVDRCQGEESNPDASEESKEDLIEKAREITGKPPSVLKRYSNKKLLSIANGD